MLVLIAAMLIAGEAPAGALPPPTHPMTISSSSHFATSDPVELERRVRNSFDLTDRNHDGFIDLNEAPIAERGHRNADGDRVVEEASNTLWIRLMDTGGDMRVEWSEMRTYLLPQLLHENGLD